MDLLSKLIMSKRKRELTDIVIILRGVPGSGKTTTAHQLYEMFKLDYDYYVEIISRDTKRLCYCKRHGIDYQASFRDPYVNSIIRDKYFEDMYEHFRHYFCAVAGPTVTIIDSSNTKIADLRHTFWTIRNCKDTLKNLDVYVYTKRNEHGSIHNVPQCIMERFREELKESDEWLKSHSKDYNLKIVNKVGFK